MPEKPEGGYTKGTIYEFVLWINGKVIFKIVDTEKKIKT